MDLCGFLLGCMRPSRGREREGLWDELGDNGSWVCGRGLQYSPFVE